MQIKYCKHCQEDKVLTSEGLMYKKTEIGFIVKCPDCGYIFYKQFNISWFCFLKRLFCTIEGRNRYYKGDIVQNNTSRYSGVDLNMSWGSELIGVTKTTYASTFTLWYRPFRNKIKYFLYCLFKFHIINNDILNPFASEKRKRRIRNFILFIPLYGLVKEAYYTHAEKENMLKGDNIILSVAAWTFYHALAIFILTYFLFIK